MASARYLGVFSLLVASWLTSIVHTLPGSPAAAAAQAFVPSGQLAPTAVPAGWKLAFTDDFTGTKLNSRWFAYGGQPGGDPGGYWATSHVQVANGILQLKGYRDPKYGNRFVTGGVSTSHGFTQTYGKYLVRFRVDQGQGISYAALLWPANNSWPPEIDFAEDNGVAARPTTQATIHYSGPGKSDLQITAKKNVALTAWHTLGVEWTKGKVRYTLDGQVWATIASTHVPSVPMALDLQTQAWYCGHNWEHCPAASTPGEVDMDVDWVVAYRPS
jgi:beta-glucanase (GH16 family)